MTDIGKDVLLANSKPGTRSQVSTARDGAPGMGRSIEARKLGLQRRRAKGLDDFPGHPDNNDGFGKSKAKKKGKKKKGP